MSSLALVPLRRHKVGRFLHGLIPMDHAMVWEPDRGAGRDLPDVPTLPYGTQYVAVASDNKSADARLTRRGFVDTGVHLDDGRHVLVRRQQAA